MLKVLIDATPCMPRPSGIGLYVANLLAALAPLQASENFQLGIVYQPGLKNWLRRRFDFPPNLQGYPDRHLFPLPVRLSNLFIRFPGLFLPYFEQFLGQPDLLHGTNYTVFPCRHSLRVMTLYDLTFIRYPAFTNATVKAYADFVRRCLKWTDLVLTISESSRQDIIEYLQVNPDRVQVTHLASRYQLADGLAPLEAQPLPGIPYDFRYPYILFVSTIEPRKNITGILQAFNYLKQRHQIPHHLVFIGQKGWHYEPIFAEMARSPYAREIHHLNYLPDAVVTEFYRRADVFVYPSHYEGFGLPVLEAMTLGAPVITSCTSSLPEVAGNAALMVEPQAPMALADAMLKVVSDRALRQQLIQQGREQARRFSWEQTARQTLKAYQSLV